MILCYPHFLASFVFESWWLGSLPFQVDPADVNVFCSSQLWREQLLPTVCRPLEESEFVIPGCAQSSAEGRRNYTDVQETAQWLGGSQIPSAILASLTSGFLVFL